MVGVVIFDHHFLYCFMKISDPIIVVESTYPCSPEKVWTAVTQLEEMRQWYFDNIPSFEAKVGFETSFLVKAPSRDFLHQWKVTEVIPNQKIAYNWTFDGIQGESTSVFELIPKGENTLLRLSCEVLQDFPDGIPEFKRESCIAGWEYFLGQQLKNYLQPAY